MLCFLPPLLFSLGWMWYFTIKSLLGGETMSLEIITVIITGVVTIAASIISFAASCRNGNHVTKEAKLDLSKEHAEKFGDVKNQHMEISNKISNEHAEISNIISDEIKDLNNTIEKEITKKEAMKNALTPEQVSVNQMAEKITAMHSDWLNLTAKVKVLEQENERLRIENHQLKNQNQVTRRKQPPMQR